MNIMLYRFIWLVPFLSFFGGYYAISLVFRPATHVLVPKLIGLDLHEASIQADNQQLFLRVIQEVTDDHQAPGTIVECYPGEGSFVKPYHKLEVVVVKKPEKKVITNFHDKILSAIQEPYKHALVSYKYPADKVCAQWPCALTHYEIDKVPELVIYTALPANTYQLMPSFDNLTQQEVYDYCAIVGLEPIFYYTSLKETSVQRVIEQRPAARTIIDLKKPPVIHIKLS